jgi:Glyoxalase-like domain
MNRLRPDGYRLEWMLTLAVETQGITPFLIEDITPREERVPERVDHVNGAIGISALTIAVREAGVARLIESLLGDGRSVADERGQSLHYESMGHAIDFLIPGGGEAADFIASREGDGGVFALSLVTAGSEMKIDPSAAHNARLSLVHG